MKTCTKCKITKPFIDFHKKTKTKDGLKPRCKNCELAYAAEYNSRPEVVARTKDYKTENKNRFNQLRNEWRRENGVFTGTHRHRERKYGLVLTIGQHYSKIEVFDRDNWICWLCNKPIDPDLKWPDRFSASIDHVIPLIEGGRDIIENVKASHLTCNIGRNKRKGCD